VTFSFDATARVVWLDDLATGAARAGDLCTRHADALVPPQGWSRVDRRIPVAPAPEPSPVAPIDLSTRPHPAGTVVAVETDELLPHREPKRKRKRPQRWSDVPSLFDDPTAAPPMTAEPPILELVDPVPVTTAPSTGGGKATGEPVASAPASGGGTTENTDLEAPDVGEPRTAPVDESVTAWEPRFDVDDLGGLLDAKSPLLSRAFRAAKTADTDNDDTHDDEVF
jgi:hypothetical protein